MRTVHVDFNEQTRHGHLRALLQSVPLATVGDSVMCRDADGNSCEGEIVQIDMRKLLIRIQPDFSTWKPAC